MDPPPAPDDAEKSKAGRRERLAKAERDMSLMLGRVAALMMGSPEHRYLFVADLEWRLVPPLALRQCRLVQRGGLPVAFLSWALLDEARERRRLAGNRRLAPADWRSGDRLWLIDLIAPGGDGEALAREVMAKLFPGRVFRTLKRGTGQASQGNSL